MSGQPVITIRGLTNRFGSVGAVSSDSTAALIAGLDTGMQAILSDVVEWVRSMA